ncbi:hypothetical protein KI387_005453, partial [Taxus chinensis]
GGILFKGNLRGEATNSYTKLTKKLQERFGDQYKLFLLVNPEDDRPVAVVVPKESLQAEPTAVPEWFAASAFGLVTVYTILLRNSPAFQLNFLSSFGNLGLLKEGLPGALITVAILGAHEIGHILVARKVGAELAVPYFVPSWQIGSFGAITRIKNVMPNRKDLLQFAVAGPLAGFSLAFLILLTGFILPPNNGQEVILDVSVFHESFLVGSIAKVILGDVLKEGTKVAVNPLVIWAWSGLLINALNSIPAGELDGGRISQALWGRKEVALEDCHMPSDVNLGDTPSFDALLLGDRLSVNALSIDTLSSDALLGNAPLGNTLLGDAPSVGALLGDASSMTQR